MRINNDVKLKWDERKYKEFVLSKLTYGSVFNAPKDLYNTDRVPKELTPRKVENFYRNYVLTVDLYGKHECYKYQDLYRILRNDFEDQ